MHLGPNLLSAFVTLLVTIGPVETAVIFAGVTASAHRPERIHLALRAVSIAGAMPSISEGERSEAQKPGDARPQA